MIKSVDRDPVGRVDFSTMAGNWHSAHSDTYTVYFSSQDDLNIMNTKNDIYIFPALSVEEHLYSVEFNEIRLIDGLTLPFPQSLQEYGYITIVFMDNEQWKLHNLLQNWGCNWQKSDEGIFTKPEEQIKTIFIERTDLTGRVVALSAYGVLPPESLRASNSTANSIVENTISLRVVQLYNLGEMDKMTDGLSSIAKLGKKDWIKNKVKEMQKALKKGN